jgi:hypothetical protein
MIHADLEDAASYRQFPWVDPPSLFHKAQIFLMYVLIPINIPRILQRKVLAV